MSNNQIIMGEFKEFCLWLRRNRGHLEPLVVECANGKHRSAYSAFESVREDGHKMPNIYRAPFARMMRAWKFTDWKVAKSSKWARFDDDSYKDAGFVAICAPEDTWEIWLNLVFGDA